MSTATRRRAVPRPRLPRLRLRRRLPRLGPRILLAVLVLAGVLTGAYFWVRQSSLVSVQRVTITGVSGPNAAVIRQRLVQSAERMTTMDINSRALKSAVAQYPVVRSLRVSTHLPHAATIAVFEQVPVAVLGGVTVSARGTLLRSINPSSQAVPTITAKSATGATGGASDDMVSGTARADVYMLTAAPYPMLAKLTTAGWMPGRGLTATLRNGPIIFFGDDTQLAAKWRSVIAVLASSTSTGASYIDVTDPARPAAGTGSDTQATEPSTTSGALTATTGETTADTGVATTN